MNTLFAYYEREEYMNTIGARISFARNLQMEKEKMS